MAALINCYLYRFNANGCGDAGRAMGLICMRIIFVWVENINFGRSLDRSGDEYAAVFQEKKSCIVTFVL